MVAYRLVDLIGRASAANILGISIRELEKLVAVYELSSRFQGTPVIRPARSPGRGSSWGVSQKTADALRGRDAVVDKVAAKRITRIRKTLRRLRQILPGHPVAREHFVSKTGRHRPRQCVRLGVAPKNDKSGLQAGDLDSTIESMKRVPWTALSPRLTGDQDIIKKIDEAEALLEIAAQGARTVRIMTCGFSQDSQNSGRQFRRAARSTTHLPMARVHQIPCRATRRYLLKHMMIDRTRKEID